jgi:hypothetical protein
MCNTFYTENVKSMKRLMVKVGLTSAIVWKSDRSMKVSVAGSVFFVTWDETHKIQRITFCPTSSNKQSRYTPWRRLGGEEVELLLILDLGTRWGWVVSITPRPRFTPGERTLGTHCTGGWVGPRAGLDTEASGKILCPRRESNPDRPVVQPVVRHYTAWANPAPNVL